MVSTIRFLVARCSAVRDFVESAHVAQVATRKPVSKLMHRDLNIDNTEEIRTLVT